MDRNLADSILPHKESSDTINEKADFVLSRSNKSEVPHGQPPDGKTPISEEDGQTYLTGPTLYMTMASLTFVAFLMLLDVSVVATVS